MNYLGILVLVIGYLAYRHLRWNKATFVRTHVYDGDSIRIDGDKSSLNCRIVGYDSPEWDQAHGRQATQGLKDLLANGYRYRVVGVDAYDRALISVRNAKGSIARQMIASGHAHNCANWGLQQFVARITSKGLWTDRNAVHPTIFRMLKK